MTKARCPVCNFPDGLSATERYQEICPCCGVQFGLDDANVGHAELRRRWALAGKPWWSTGTPPPEDWDADTQLNSRSEKP